MNHPGQSPVPAVKETGGQGAGMTVPSAEVRSGMDPDAILEYLRETMLACLSPDSLNDGEFPAHYAVNALEALTTFAALDEWLSSGGRPPTAWLLLRRW